MKKPGKTALSLEIVTKNIPSEVVNYNPDYAIQNLFRLEITAK